MEYLTRMLMVVGVVTFYGSLQVLFNEISLVPLFLVAAITAGVFWCDSIFSVVKAFKDAVFRTRTI
jgi:hypothetical protein